MAKKKKKSRKVNKSVSSWTNFPLSKYFSSSYMGNISKEQTSISMRDVVLRSYLIHISELVTYVSNSHQGLYGNSRKELNQYEDKLLIISGVVSSIRNFGDSWKVLLRAPALEGYFESGSLGEIPEGTFLSKSVYFDNHLWLDLNHFYIKDKEYLDLGNDVPFPLIAGSHILLCGRVKRYTGDVGGVSGFKYGFADSVYLLGNYTTFTSHLKDAKVEYVSVLGGSYLRSNNKPKFAFIPPNSVVPRDFCLGELRFQRVSSNEGDYLSHPKVSFYTESRVNKLVGEAYSQVSNKTEDREVFNQYISSVLCGLSVSLEKDYRILKAMGRGDIPIVAEEYVAWSNERKLLNYSVPLVSLNTKIEGEN